MLTLNELEKLLVAEDQVAFDELTPSRAYPGAYVGRVETHNPDRMQAQIVEFLHSQLPGSNVVKVYVESHAFWDFTTVNVIFFQPEEVHMTPKFDYMTVTRAYEILDRVLNWGQPPTTIRFQEEHELVKRGYFKYCDSANEYAQLTPEGFQVLTLIEEECELTPE